MYLKTEPFGPNQVVLSELSGLQRIEYLEAIVEHMSALENIPDAIPEANKMAIFGSLTIKLHAWLVSRSLWQQDRERALDDIFNQVLNDWPPRLINEAALLVQQLSGIVPESASEEPADESTSSTPGKS
ncbi:phage tail assembly chaperone G [Symbiopectobacterium purcellii]|uniref:Phage minor tail protein G n=1 Tax=Symbiopectobacterium purcellii TaxID=2871826 RepID=A0ABX9AIH0_9ENTR|nr:phage minor tail protein G [Symbiopectobacterium purcellii]QZN94913.1 phage minor tail protein G [Symbiopectobacterium purcellii]